MSEALLLAVVGLLLLPSLTRRLRAHLAPSEWARINATSLVAAVVLFEVALIVCAFPLLLFFINGGEQRHFFPGGIFAGYVSLITAVALPVSVAIGIARLVARRRVLRAEPWFGEHHLVDGVDIVLLPTRAELAFSLPGRPPQIVLSEGLVEVLTEDELRTVIQHEAAHIRYRHSRYLLVVAALAPIFGHLRPVRESLDSLELSLECWADAAAGPTSLDRRSTRSALMTLSHTYCGTGIAAFSKAEAAAIRLESLSDGPAVTKPQIRMLLYGTLAVLAAIPVASLWSFAG